MKNNPTNITSSGASKKLVPELRFPEFQNDGEWEIVILGDVFERVTDKNKENCQNVVTISAQHGLVSQYDYFNKNVAAANVTNYYVIKKGDFAYNKSRSLGYPYGAIKQLRYYDKGVVSTLYICFRLIDNNGIKDFFDQYFETPLINLELGKLAQEGARNHGLLNISTEDFFDKISLFIPSQIEQQRIAQCLSSLDERIAATKEKVELLKEHKRGLMQKLFPAKGKTLPELRFPEFKNDGDWEEYALGELTNVTNRRNKSNRKLPIYSISNKGGFIPQSEQFDGLDSNSRGYDISMYKLVGKNTFAYNPARINVGSIGYSGDLKEVIISSLYVCFKTTEKIEDDFLSCFTNTTLFRQSVEINVEGGIRSYLFYENFSKIKIWLPTITEQKKIASFFHSIDDLIDYYSSYLEILELQKIGLMQKIFPKIK